MSQRAEGQGDWNSTDKIDFYLFFNADSEDTALDTAVEWRVSQKGRDLPKTNNNKTVQENTAITVEVI